MKTYTRLIAATILSIGCISCDDASEVGSGGSSTGQTGSLARFGIVNQNLYAIDAEDLFLTSIRRFDLSTPTKPSFSERMPTDLYGETLTPFDGKLYMGARDGVAAYDVAADGSLKRLFNFSRQVACDPVVVKGDYVYSTLNSRTNCGGFLNELQVLKGANSPNPQLVHQEFLQGPVGLGIDQNRLIVCDYREVIVYNLDNPAIPEEQSRIDLQVKDVLVLADRILFTGDFGIYQYTYNPTTFLYEKRSALTY